VNLAWDRVADGIHRCRLPFLDVTVGLVGGSTGTLLIDTGITLLEANAVKADVAELADSLVSHIVLTHNHFDHILGSSAFADATVYCAPEVAATIATRTEELRADAVRHGADADEVTSAIAALQVPRHSVYESGDPVIGPDSDQKAWPATLGRVLVAGGPDAAYVPEHGRSSTRSSSSARDGCCAARRCD
jgi:glyoxylase-like metal-dependent hydrolase (beta-lactamase superfamily II)